MATEKQIEANRLNALRSTGPKSEEGKAASRLNAVTHGLTAILPTAIEQSLAEFEERKKEWRAELQPVGDFQEAMFEQIVVESIRTDRCHRTYLALCIQHANRAKVDWDGDRRRHAADLAVGLSKNPRGVAERLAETPHGCDLMMDLWKGLRASLDRHKTWTDKQRALALDLLGTHAELRDAETPLDPASGDVFKARMTVVDRELARLVVARDRVKGMDECERAMAKQTLGAEFTKPVLLLDRYERNAFRRYQLAMRALKTSQRGDLNETKPISPPKAASKVETPREPKPETPRPVALPVARVEVTAVPAPVATKRSQSDASLVGLNRHQRRKLAALQRRAG